MAGQKFVRADVDEYLMFIEECRKERRDIDTEFTYSFFQSLRDAVDEMNYRDAMAGLVSDVTPVW